jgi:cyanophycinase
MLFASPAHAQTSWWPSVGSVILGGGSLSAVTFDSVAHRLIALAGGPDAPIVIIPTANESVAPRLRGTGPALDPMQLKGLLESKGAKHVTILHTRDRAVANSDAFLAPLRAARGVWIPGGGSRILEQAYLGTRVAAELRAVLTRGGVIFGDSAGAIALGCFMLGWTPDPWGIVTNGLGILPYVAVVPHASAARGYVPADEILGYLKVHPGPAGIAIDENTAIVLTRAQVDVIGPGVVAVIDPARNIERAYLSLRAGASLNVAK